jgi:hypothetical protein
MPFPSGFVYLDANCRPVRTRSLWTIYLVRDPYGIGYVGCTSRRMQIRRADHCCGYSSGNLYRMIKACGAKNCSLTIIDEAISLAEARVKERKHILARQTLHPLGYNRKLLGIPRNPFLP